MFGASNDGTDASQAGSGEEVVVSEHEAALLVRHRAAEVIEVIERSGDGHDKN
jgi:hypothetical protein